MRKYFSQLQSAKQIILNSSITRFAISHKRSLAILILLISFVFFGYYLTNHPDILTHVVSIGFFKGTALLILYFAVVLTNFAIMYATVRLCRKDLPLKNGILLSMYSSVINFFGPLQSGPTVRAIYLKTKLGLRIRDYTLAMIFYYFAYAAINSSLLFVNRWPWLSTLGILGGMVITIIGTKQLGFGPLGKYVMFIFMATVLQIICMIAIYTIELQAITTGYSWQQIASYTASANLSLFVSLTPGGIGIREAFLIFSQSLHHIQLGSIIAAGILDRAVYVTFLLILFVISSSLHLKKLFVFKQRA